MYIVIILFLIVSCGYMYHIHRQKVHQYESKIRRGNHNLDVITKWMLKERQGKTIEHFLLEYNYRTVAIYGMGKLGECLYYELKNSNINVKYGVDRNESIKIEGLQVYHSTEENDKVDAMIVTALFSCVQVEKAYGDNLPGIIISLEDIIDEM